MEKLILGLKGVMHENEHFIKEIDYKNAYQSMSGNNESKILSIKSKNSSPGKRLFDNEDYDELTQNEREDFENRYNQMLEKMNYEPEPYRIQTK